MKYLQYLFITTCFILVASCNVKPFLAYAKINSENVVEVYEHVVEFLQSSGFRSSGKSELKTPDGVSIIENFEKDNLVIGVYLWTPKNILEVAFIPESNSEKLNEEELIFINSYCRFLKMKVSPEINIAVNTSAEDCK